MKNRTPLALIEMMLLMLVFAFVAAVCLRVFVKSDEISRKSEARDYAIIKTQSAAEIIRQGAGDFEIAAAQLGGEAEGDTLVAPCDAGGAVKLILRAERLNSDIHGLGEARVWTSYENGEELFSLKVMWQEGNDDE